MVNEFKNVIEFNNQVIGLTCVDYLSKNRLEWFKGVINEELGEFEVANNNYIEAKGSHDDYMAQCCRAEMADALIDLIYFAYGRLYEIGIFPEAFEQMWSAVHQANMKKKKGNKGRGSDLDAVKPEGWEAPEKKFFNTSLPVEGSLGEDTSLSELSAVAPTTAFDIHQARANTEGITRQEAKQRNYMELYGPVTKRFPCDRPNLSNPPSSIPGVEFVCDLKTIAAMPKVFIDAVELCIKKSQDYNNGQDKPASRSEYFPFGLLSYAQMLHTKTQRLNSLAQQTKAPNHESIRDTLIDLINYAGFAAEAIDKGEI